MKQEIRAFHEAQIPEEKEICDLLFNLISEILPEAENKIWHDHPVWFIEGNPIVGYSKLKGCIRLFFWSGADFDEEQLKQGTGKFKDASIRYSSIKQIDEKDVKRWIEKSKNIQWDYRSLIKRKGRFERLRKM